MKVLLPILSRMGDLDGGYELRSVLHKNESFFGFRTPQRGVPGEGLSDLDPLPRLWGGDDLARGVAGHAALVVVPPAVGEAFCGVEAAAVVEGVGQGTAGAGGLLPHAPEDGIADLLPAGCLVVRLLLEVDDVGEVGVESAALGADDQHRPASQ